MATASQTVPALLTLEEYRLTKYHPDCEYIDGHLEERTKLGSPKHAQLQMQLAFWFISPKKEWGAVVMGDVRTRTGQTRVRLPDVVIISQEAAALDDPWINKPPLIVIEILSPEDRIKRVLVRLEEFRAFGVSNIWLLDPVTQTAQTYTESGLKQVEESRLILPNSPIYLDLPELFAALD